LSSDPAFERVAGCAAHMRTGREVVKRAFAAMMEMRRIDVAAIEVAAKAI
jgi:hypothetical protein